MRDKGKTTHRADVAGCSFQEGVNCTMIYGMSKDTGRETTEHVSSRKIPTFIAVLRVSDLQVLFQISHESQISIKH